MATTVRFWLSYDCFRLPKQLISFNRKHCVVSCHISVNIFQMDHNTWVKTVFYIYSIFMDSNFVHSLTLIQIMGYNITSPKRKSVSVIVKLLSIRFCSSDCGKDYQVDGGTVHFDGHPTTYQSKVSISCSDGYDLNGNNYTTCLATGKWDKTSSCKPKGTHSGNKLLCCKRCFNINHFSGNSFLLITAFVFYMCIFAKYHDVLIADLSNVSKYCIS